MRLYSFVAAAVVASASLAAHAESITQTFTIPFDYSYPGYTNYTGTMALTPFNPADGTLNSATLSFYGSYAVDAGTTLHAGAQFAYPVIQSMPSPSQAGTYQISLSETVSDAFDLQRFENPFGIYGPDLTSANVTAAITFNYTPVAATPEPSSFALLGTGLLGALSVARKRFA